MSISQQDFLLDYLDIDWQWITDRTMEMQANDFKKNRVSRIFDLYRSLRKLDKGRIRPQTKSWQGTKNQMS